MTRLDGIRVRELPIPTSVSLSSVISGFNDTWQSNRFLMGVGESATITASVLDQNGAIMTDLVPMISTTAANGIMAFTHLNCRKSNIHCILRRIYLNATSNYN